MERLFDSKKPTDKGFFADPSHRMSKRPAAVKSGAGVGFEVFGSSFDPPKARITYGKSSKSKSKSRSILPPRPSRTTPPRISEDESDDQLLLSSQPSAGGDATSPLKRAVKGKKTYISSSDEETVRVNGRDLKAHPDYKPSSLNTLKMLRFTKNKKNTSAGDTVADVPPSSSLNDSQELSRPILDDIEILDGSPPGGPSSSRQSLLETRQGSPSTTRTTARRLPDAKDPSTSKLPSPTAKDTPRAPPKPRPKPRVVITVRERGSSSESTPPRAAQKHGFPLSSKTPERSVNAEDKRTVKKSALPLPSPLRREPQEFPMPLRTKENVSDDARSGDASTSRTKKTSIPRSATFVHTPKPIALPSPLNTKPVARGSTFPNLSPLLSSQNKGKERAKSPNEDDVALTDGQEKRGGLRPFPMSSQMLASIDRRSKSPSLKSTKRASSEDSDAEQARSTKKRKDSISRVPDTFDYMEDDSIDLGHARDPSKMCPYCDEDLPSHPTPFLQHLLTTARKKSVSDPRPRNRGGLKAPLTVYISVCQRHRFESHQLPIAAERGWPKTIDFTKVPARVKRMKKDLEAIILDNDDISDIDDLPANSKTRGPRSESIFWREVKKEVKKQGSRTVVGVKGQFASFEKTQPGYYGEQGSVIIHQTLFDLFPPSMFDASLIMPLAPAEFIQRILVPEAAVRLIAQDMCLDMEDAIVTLRDSAQYGVAMFPDTSETKRKGTGDANDGMGVADKIVMERARARRKEIAEEERVELEMLEEERAAQRAKAQESRREKAVVRAQQARETNARTGAKEAEDASEASGAGATRRTRRETRQRSVVDDSESDAMSVDSLASRRSARVGKKGVRGDGRRRVKATPQPNCSDSDSVEVVDDSKPKTTNKGSKTREHSAAPDTRVAKETAAPRKKTFGGSAALDSDGECENTPRPARQRTETAATGSTVNGSHACMLPLQMARNRLGASVPTPHDGWSRSLRKGSPEDVDSDASNSSRRSQRLVHPPIKKNRGEFSWLLNESSSADSL